MTDLLSALAEEVAPLDTNEEVAARLVNTAEQILELEKVLWLDTAEQMLEVLKVLKVLKGG